MQCDLNMPAVDRNHQIVIRSLQKAGLSIISEQYSLAIGTTPEDIRRLYIDIAAQSQTSQVVLIEVKLLDKSPIHQFMMLIGQYIVYQAALDYLGDDTPLYVAITESDYHVIIQHPLGQAVMNQMLKSPIPMIIYDAIDEEILRWIPPL